MRLPFATLREDAKTGASDRHPAKASQRNRPEPVAAAAVAALESFAGWLDEQAAAVDPGRDPRLGRLRWEAKLWHTLDTELTAAEVNRLAWENLEQVTADIRAAAAELMSGRPAPGHRQVRRGAGAEDDIAALKAEAQP